jgi:hypothetical protein
MEGEQDVEDQVWVRAQIVAALWESDNDCSEPHIERQADSIMRLLERTAGATDTYHVFVGYLNDLRLRGKAGEGSDG